MSWVLILIFCFSAFIVTAFGGLWIGVALGVVGVIGMALTPFSASQVIANCVWNICVNFPLSSVPLFLFMGELIIFGGLSKKLYKGISKYLRNVPGGMLLTNIAACGVFSAIVGSSPACSAAIGGVAIPEMKNLGYNKKHVYGSIAGGGTLGILIPPSIPLVIYAAIVSESVVKLFAAAIIPGIILMSFYMLYIIILYLVRKDYAQQVDFSVYEEIGHGEALMGFLPIVLLIFSVLGTMFLGFATPTEASGLGTFGAIILGFVFGDLTPKKLWQAAQKAVTTTAMILFIVFGASIFSYVLSSTNATGELVKWMVGLQLNKTVFLICLYILYIFLGCFLNSSAIQYLTLPILLPVLQGYGINIIWFAIIMVVLLELGLLTPPVGLNVFVIKGVAKEASLSDVFKGSVPYMAIMLGFIILLTCFPQLVTTINV